MKINAINVRSGNVLEIEGKLGNAQIIDPTTLNAEGRVVFGATVEYEDLESEKKSTYQIVGEDEADPKTGSISFVSPVASRLMGRGVGDVVAMGDQELEITAIG